MQTVWKVFRPSRKLQVSLKPTLERSLMNANSVESVLSVRAICKHMKRPTVEKIIMSANSVESVLSVRTIGEHMKRPTPERSLMSANSVESVLPLQEA